MARDRLELIAHDCDADGCSECVVTSGKCPNGWEWVVTLIGLNLRDRHFCPAHVGAEVFGRVQSRSVSTLRVPVWEKRDA